MRKAGCASTSSRFYGCTTALMTERRESESGDYRSSTNKQLGAVAHESFVTPLARLRHACNITRFRLDFDCPLTNRVPIARIRLRHPVERKAQLRGIDHAAEDP